MKLRDWASMKLGARGISPEQKAAKKESAARVKSLSKAATAASNKASVTGTLEDHKAAQGAHEAASAAAQKHYYGFRHSQITAEGIHDDQRAHAREANSHAEKVKGLEKEAAEKKSAEYAERQKDPRVQSENKAKAAEKAADAHMEQAHRVGSISSSARDSYAQAHEKYKEAHNHYLDAGQLTPATNMAKWAGRSADKAGIDFDAEKHPRDEHGRFTSK